MKTSWVSVVLKSSLAIAAWTFFSLSFGQGCIPPAEAAVVAHPAGTMLPDIGTSDMPIASKSEKAKQLTRQGFALIHCFWPYEAIRSFREATKEDPTCAIAWCGLNIALTQPWFYRQEYKAEAEYAIKKAIANIETASEPEQDLIRAFRLRSIGQNDRDSEFEKAMQALVDKHQKLDEPRLLWAGIRCQLCMNVAYQSNGDPQGDLEFVAKIIEPVLKRNPNSAGAMHYWIHAMEPYSPSKAEKAADNLRKIGKGSPHLVHMPGHIYNRIGRYEDAEKSFGAARKMDEALAEKLGVTPYEADWQYGHNVSFQAMNLLELGRINEAIELSKITGNIRSDIALRVRDWKNAYRADRTDARGKAIANVYEARIALDAKDLAGARSKALEAKKLFEKAERAYERTEYRIIKTIALEVEGLILAEEGKIDEAIQALRGSISAFRSVEYEEPVVLIQTPYESLGALLVRAKRFDEAIKAYQEGLSERPNSGWMLYGIAWAHEEAGRSKEAEKAYKAFLKTWASADRDRPEIKKAESFLATLAASRRR